MCDELKLISSLNTLGDIEFDVLCNPNNLEKKLSLNADFSLSSRHTYHIMVHRVCRCSNVDYHFIDEHQNQEKGCSETNHIMSRSTCSSLFDLSKQNQFQGEHAWMISQTATTTSVSIDDSKTRRGE